MQLARQMFLLYILASLNIIERECDFLQFSTLDRSAYGSTIFHVFALNCIQLYNNTIFTAEELSFVPGMFHGKLQNNLNISKKRNPQFA